MTRRILLCLLLSSLFCSMLQAGNGKATMNYWLSNSSTSETSHIFLSNITENDINVTITVYSYDGSVVTSGLSYTNMTSTVLAAGKTGYLSMATSSLDWGYAVIEWENQSGNDDVVALVCNGLYARQSGGHSRHLVPINDGMPF